MVLFFVSWFWVCVNVILNWLGLIFVSKSFVLICWFFWKCNVISWSFTRLRIVTVLAAVMVLSSVR